MGEDNYDDDEKSKRSRFRAMISNEIIETEQRYNDDLQLINKKLMEPLQSASSSSETTNVPSVAQSDIRLIFSQMTIILAVSSSLLSALSSPDSASPPSSTVTLRFGDIFVNFAPQFKLYAQYAACYDEAAARAAELTAKNSSLSRWLEAQLEQPRGAAKQALLALLILPIQRIPRYVMLLTELLKHTETDHDDYSSLQKAVDALKSTADYVNEKTREAAAAAALRRVTLRMSSTDDATASLLSRLIQPDRRLVQESWISQVHADGFGSGSKKKRVVALLLSDLLLICKGRDAATAMPSSVSPLSMSGNSLPLAASTSSLASSAEGIALGTSDGHGGLLKLVCFHPLSEVDLIDVEGEPSPIASAAAALVSDKSDATAVLEGLTFQVLPASSSSSLGVWFSFPSLAIKHAWYTLLKKQIEQAKVIDSHRKQSVTDLSANSALSSGPLSSPRDFSVNLASVLSSSSPPSSSSLSSSSAGKQNPVSPLTSPRKGGGGVVKRVFQNLRSPRSGGGGKTADGSGASSSSPSTAKRLDRSNTASPPSVRSLSSSLNTAEKSGGRSIASLLKSPRKLSLDSSNPPAAKHDHSASSRSPSSSSSSGGRKFHVASASLATEQKSSTSGSAILRPADIIETSRSSASRQRSTTDPGPKAAAAETVAAIDVSKTTTTTTRTSPSSTSPAKKSTASARPSSCQQCKAAPVAALVELGPERKKNWLCKSCAIAIQQHHAEQRRKRRVEEQAKQLKMKKFSIVGEIGKLKEKMKKGEAINESEMKERERQLASIDQELESLQEKKEAPAKKAVPLPVQQSKPVPAGKCSKCTSWLVAGQCERCGSVDSSPLPLKPTKIHEEAAIAAAPSPVLQRRRASMKRDSSSLKVNIAAASSSSRRSSQNLSVKVKLSTEAKKEPLFSKLFDDETLTEKDESVKVSSGAVSSSRGQLGIGAARGRGRGGPARGRGRGGPTRGRGGPRRQLPTPPMKKKQQDTDQVNDKEKESGGGEKEAAIAPQNYHQLPLAPSSEADAGDSVNTTNSSTSHYHQIPEDIQQHRSRSNTAYEQVPLPPAPTSTDERSSAGSSSHYAELPKKPMQSIQYERLLPDHFPTKQEQ